jgi:hypothetical protein
VTLHALTLYGLLPLAPLLLLPAFAHTAEPAAAPAPTTAAPVFRAGAATSNITPPLGCSLNGGFADRVATHVHDELHARCLVLDDGTTRLAFAVCDSCMIPREVADEAKRQIREHTGIPPGNVLISATHTHTAPTATPVFQSDPDPAYVNFLTTRIADGVQRAANNALPAKVGWNVGKQPGHVFNRRWKMKPGTIPPDPFGGTTDRVQMNPPVGSDNLIEPAGPTDPDVWVVSIRTPDDKPLAVLANYALHYVGGGPGDHVSADYYGMFAEALRHKLGADEPERDPPFVGILSNGASGNINNIDVRNRRPPQPPYGQMRLVAEAVAEEAKQVYTSIEYTDRVTLAARTATLELSVRKPSAQDIDRAKAILAPLQGKPLRSPPEVYARETVLLADYPEHVQLVLQAFRIGDLTVVAAPCEVFVETGLELKARSPRKPLFLISLTNGYNGYLSTPEHHRLGGYETWRARSSYLEVDAAPKISAKLLELVGSLP